MTKPNETTSVTISKPDGTYVTTEVTNRYPSPAADDSVANQPGGPAVQGQDER